MDRCAGARRVPPNRARAKRFRRRPGQSHTDGQQDCGGRGHRRYRRVLPWHGRLGAGRAGRAGASLQDHAGGARVAAEVRAVYGGFGLAIAGVLVFAAIADGDLRKGILITVGAALAGMAFGRLAAAVLGDPTAFYPNWF